MKFTFYDFKLFLIRFVIIGLCGYVIEVIFTGGHRFIDYVRDHGLLEAITNLGKSTKANTGIMAFFVYCWAAIPLTFLLPIFKDITGRHIKHPVVGLVLRSVIMALIFMTIEFIIGFVGIYILGFSWENMWDYRGYFLNVLGVVTFSFFPAWFVAALIGEWLHDRLLQIDDILANPEGFSEEVYQEYRAHYEERKRRKAEEHKPSDHIFQ